MAKSDFTYSCGHSGRDSDRARSITADELLALVRAWADLPEDAP
jgi:hypothetical protein